MPLQDKTFSQARWIAPEGAKSSVDGNRTAFFRLEMILPDPLPQGATISLCVTAHTRYKLRLNGAPITVGPRKGNAQQCFYERLNITRGLLPGKNLLAAQVVSYAPLTDVGNMGYSPISVLTLPLEPALLASGGVSAQGKEFFDVTTGKADWRACTADDAIEWIRDPQTHYIGAFERWRAAKLPSQQDANAWKAAVPRWAPDMNEYGEMPPLRLAERTIPLMYEQEYGFTRQMRGADALAGLVEEQVTEIPARASLAYELDAGELTTGYMMVTIEGGAGSKVRVRYAECYRTRNENGEYIKGVRDEPCEGGLEMAYDEILPGGKPFAFESFWFRTFRFVRIEVETGDEPLKLTAPRYRRTGYPLEVKADITSDAAWVKRLFDISVRTLRCCMHETYEDCPFYEQLQYTSDTKLQMDFTYAIAGDLRMARQVIDDFHRSTLPDGMLQSRTPSQHKQAIPQFELYWIHMLHALYEQDADVAFVARYRPTIDAVLDYFERHRDERGLVTDLGYWDFGDWVPAWKHGVPDAVWEGPSTIHNLVYAWTLQVAADLMRITGREEVAREYDARSASVAGAVKAHCYDGATGLFLEGPGYSAYSQHAQVFAVLSGALEGEAAVRALEDVLGRADASKCSYPQQFYLLRALEKVGRYDLSDVVWQGLIDLLPLNITTLPETPVAPRSDCHAWSALPLYDAPRVWLGVRPTKAGWEGITVRPQFLASLDNLAGNVPTPHGDVTVAWARKGDAISIDVQSPERVPLTLELPGGERTVYERGGHASAVIRGELVTLE